MRKFILLNISNSPMFLLLISTLVSFINFGICQDQLYSSLNSTQISALQMNLNTYTISQDGSTVYIGYADGVSQLMITAINQSISDLMKGSPDPLSNPSASFTCKNEFNSGSPTTAYNETCRNFYGYVRQVGLNILACASPNQVGTCDIFSSDLVNNISSYASPVTSSLLSERAFSFIHNQLLYSIIPKGVVGIDGEIRVYNVSDLTNSFDLIFSSDAVGETSINQHTFFANVPDSSAVFYQGALPGETDEFIYYAFNEFPIETPDLSIVNIMYNYPLSRKLSRIARLCANDLGQYSVSPGGANFPLTFTKATVFCTRTLSSLLYSTDTQFLYSVIQDITAIEYNGATDYYALFTSSLTEQSLIPFPASSAICRYRLHPSASSHDSISNAFSNNFNKNYIGNVLSTPSWDCSNPAQRVSSGSAAYAFANEYILHLDQLYSSSVLNLDNLLVTGMARDDVIIIRNSAFVNITTLYLSTTNGSIVKLKIDNNDITRVTEFIYPGYTDFTMPKISTNSSGKYLLVISNLERLLKFPLVQCSLYSEGTTCCLDPSCVWEVLNRKCIDYDNSIEYLCICNSSNISTPDCSLNLIESDNLTLAFNLSCSIVKSYVYCTTPAYQSSTCVLNSSSNVNMSTVMENSANLTKVNLSFDTYYFLILKPIYDCGNLDTIIYLAHTLFTPLFIPPILPSVVFDPVKSTRQFTFVKQIINSNYSLQLCYNCTNMPTLLCNTYNATENLESFPNQFLPWVPSCDLEFMQFDFEQELYNTSRFDNFLPCNGSQLDIFPLLVFNLFQTSIHISLVSGYNPYSFGIKEYSINFSNDSVILFNISDIAPQFFSNLTANSAFTANVSVLAQCGLSAHYSINLTTRFAQIGIDNNSLSISYINDSVKFSFSLNNPLFCIDSDKSLCVDVQQQCGYLQSLTYNINFKKIEGQILYLTINNDICEIRVVPRDNPTLSGSHGVVLSVFIPLSILVKLYPISQPNCTSFHVSYEIIAPPNNNVTIVLSQGNVNISSSISQTISNALLFHLFTGITMQTNYTITLSTLQVDTTISTDMQFTSNACKAKVEVSIIFPCLEEPKFFCNQLGCMLNITILNSECLNSQSVFCYTNYTDPKSITTISTSFNGSLTFDFLDDKKFAFRLINNSANCHAITSLDETWQTFQLIINSPFIPTNSTSTATPITSSSLSSSPSSISPTDSTSTVTTVPTATTASTTSTMSSDSVTSTGITNTTNTPTTVTTATTASTTSTMSSDSVTSTSITNTTNTPTTVTTATAASTTSSMSSDSVTSTSITNTTNTPTSSSSLSTPSTTMQVFPSLNLTVSTPEAFQVSQTSTALFYISILFSLLAIFISLSSYLILIVSTLCLSKSTAKMHENVTSDIPLQTTAPN